MDRGSPGPRGETCAVTGGPPTPCTVERPFVFRVQDAAGRGPYRPGFSHVWMDLIHEQRNPTIMDEFGLPLIESMAPENANGCAFETLRQAARWFSPAERGRLDMWGYRLVVMRVDRILARSERQALVTRRLPFRHGAVALRWDLLDPASLDAAEREAVVPPAATSSHKHMINQNKTGDGGEG